MINSKYNLKIIVISDLHIGNIKSDEEALDTIYNYCCKNNIHLIINCGDLLDGTFSNTECFIPPEDQVEYLIKNYPFDKDIFTLYTPGDHDNSLYSTNNIFITCALKKRRHDICAISQYIKTNQNNIIRINNNKIIVSHKAPMYEENNLKDIKLHLIGHTHASKTLLEINQSKNSTPRIMIPPLSRKSSQDQINIPRAIELNLCLDDKYCIKYISKKDLLILNNKVLNTGETIINYSNYKLSTSSKENEKNYTNDNKHSINQIFSDADKKEVSELIDEQKQQPKKLIK